MQVLKFGGTSVANAENIRKVIAVVQKAYLKDQTIVVVSALGGATDMLIEIGKMAASHHPAYKEKLREFGFRHETVVQELLPVILQQNLLEFVSEKFNELDRIYEAVFLLRELSSRTLDSILSHGELLSSKIISAAFQSVRVENQWLDARKVIRTDSAFGFAVPDFDFTAGALGEYLLQNPAQLYIVPGFIASDSNGVTTTLGRGGSDYTAAILAAATDATALEIWTDVSGMMTADPRLVTNAKAIPYISYKEAMELSHFGARVIYPPTIQPVMKKEIPVWIKNTFAPDDYGTLIESSVSENRNTVRGISSIGKMAFLSLEGSGMVGIPGFSRRLFGALSEEKINVILITQSSSEHSICAAIDESNAEKARKAVDEEFANEIIAGKVDPLQLETGLSIIALVGDNMKNHTGISGKMFDALGRNSVNIRAIAQGSSEKNISTVINTVDVKKAINVLHEEFFETAYKQVNLYITGVGNVGSRLMAQLKKQQQYLLDHLRLQLRVVGISNSTKMVLNEDGINLQTWQETLKQGVPMEFPDFVAFIEQKNLRNPIFVDVTSSESVTRWYETLLRKSVAVVACNKIASSSSYENFQLLKHLAREYNTAYLFETNVGAGLPIIGTLNDLMRSGDKVNRIEAVLSGTLNFVFNNYDGTVPFARIVKQAQDEGYAEPDPRIDLSGTDVMRKLLILSREAGYEMEMEEIRSNSFLPDSCMQGDVANFYLEMEKHEAHFFSLYSKAMQEGCKLKFVASLDCGKAWVGLQHVGKDHDLFHLYGKDNVVLFYTNRYVQQPLVIKGAGAGADVTASGIFADIIRASRV
ncbi:MAG: bifunctional aspartate kinase/homoserine dehydrogenase I [Bacteroidetes bacterium]|nr:bifunctional aspartate kinase/homoserine dehydrogenase I [Bacteroidota bacterium]